MPRFTILLHTVSPQFERPDPMAGAGIAAGQEHWDWLFQPTGNESEAFGETESLLNSGLWTWATDPLPWSVGTKPHSPSAVTTPALRLVDHRARYLDFEGQIDGDRGTVTQIATGHYELKRLTSDCFQAILNVSKSRLFDRDCIIFVQFSRSDSDFMSSASSSNNANL